MHDAAYRWVNRHATAEPVTVVEIGARNVNGGVRDLFPHASWYGIDIADGPDVDEVADGATWQPAKPVDIVVCCEVLEHTDAWREIVANAAAMLVDGGTLILTAAGPERPPHSAFDGGPLRDGEHYGNIDPDELAKALAAAGLNFVVDVAGGDVRASGRKMAAKAKRKAG